MRIYYRGYLIDDDKWSADCAVYGTRPERQFLTVREDSQSAMRWIDCDVTHRLDVDIAGDRPRWGRNLPLPV